MDGDFISRLARETIEIKRPLNSFIMNSQWTRRQGEASICDFVLGNPHDPAPPGYVEALQAHLIPEGPSHFAYKTSEPHAQRTVAASLTERYGLPFRPEDIVMTTGAFAGIANSLRAVIDPGDEVVMFTPCWFSYDTLVMASGGVPVRVPLHAPSFDMNLTALGGTLNERTRAVIINSPHNPTGRVYGGGELGRLAALLGEVSERTDRPIYLISDESYSRIVFDEIEFPTPAAHYPFTFMVYTYGKTLLTPGERLGYVALPPSMPNRRAVAAALFVSQIAAGWSFPNALLQHAIADLDRLSIDVKHLQTKRDRLLEALSDYGYEVNKPAGTFYLLPKAPIEDDFAFTDRLANDDVFVLPGTLVEMPGYFRISLTATDEMIERALPVFAKANGR